MNKLSLDKQKIRQAIIAKRLTLSPTKRTQAIDNLIKNFQSLEDSFLKHKMPNWPTDIIGGYLPIKGEFDPSLLMLKLEQQGAQLALPVIQNTEQMLFRQYSIIKKTHLQKKAFNLLEPSETSPQIIPNLFLVPLVAFDENCTRLGYGKGYYDRFFAKLSQQKAIFFTIGIAFECQKQHNLPHNKFDKNLDFILTESQIYHSQ